MFVSEPAPSGCAPTVFIVNGLHERKWRKHQSAAAEIGETQFTQHAGHAMELAQRAAEQGAGVVCAVGGDGCLSEVVNGLMQHAVASGALPGATAVALIPLGTGSDFRRSVGLPHDVSAALQHLKRCLATSGTGSTGASSSSSGGGGGGGLGTPINVLRISCLAEGGPVSRFCINICSCGVSAAAAPLIAKHRWLGPTLGYSLAGLQALLTTPRYQAQLRLDASEWLSLPALTLVAVGNGACFAGGMRICPGANPRSSSMQVTALNGLGTYAFLRHQGTLRSGQLEKIKQGVGLHTARQRVELRLAGPDEGQRCLVECDGEAVGWAPLTVELLPAALRFCV